MLIASAFARGPSEIFVEQVGEIPWISLTLDWMKRVGIPYTHNGFSHYRLPGDAEIEAFTYRVPADFSSLLYPIGAALITSSELTIHELDFSDTQGDKKVLTYLQEMGASLDVDQSRRLVHVRRGGALRGMAIDLDTCIDALPLLAVLGCYAEGVTTLRGGRSARYKESDRIASTAQELRKMGAVIEEKPDGLVIHHSPLQGASLFAHADHRLALSLAVAGLGVRRGPTLIRGVEYADKSYPGFCAALQSLGGNISLCS
jgi:3-phosphoshikimate 1-carboxyvinyltransferase